MKTSTAPWGRSMLLGILATAVLSACTPLWMLGQMGGPVDFSYLLLGVGIPALLLALFLVKTRGIPAAIVCGLLFSIPIATFCWLLRAYDSKLDYFNDMRTDGVLAVIVSIIVMVVATFQRQLNQPAPQDEQNSTTN